MFEIDQTDLPARDGWDLHLRLLADPDPRPTDYDCYDAAQIQAWKNGDWQFVTLQVSASRNGIELGDSYLGAVEYGQLSSTLDINIDAILKTHASEIADLADEATAAAADQLTKLNAPR